MQTTKIEIKSITLERGEGPHHLVDKPYTAGGFEQASDWLAVQAATAPEGGGYDKVDFEILFEDGKVYPGRYDLRHFSEEIPDLKVHVRLQILFYSGQYCPSHLTEDQYQKYLTWTEDYYPQGREQYQHIKDNYTI